MAVVRQLLLAGSAVIFLAGVLQLVGVATHNWISVDGVVHMGLWAICAKDKVKHVVMCVSITENVPGWLNATRAFGIIATAMMLFAAVCGLVTILKAGHATLTKLAAVLCAAGAVCSVVCFGVFASKYKNFLGDSPDLPDFLDPKFDYSFGLTVTATILSSIASALFLRSRQTEYSSL
ncbi:hypothetical protein ACOMHN_047231 [Nucella lapillus]